MRWVSFCLFVCFYQFSYQKKQSISLKIQKHNLSVKLAENNAWSPDPWPELHQSPEGGTWRTATAFAVLVTTEGSTKERLHLPLQ